MVQPLSLCPAGEFPHLLIGSLVSVDVTADKFIVLSVEFSQTD